MTPDQPSREIDGRRRVGPYRLDAAIGAGGMGEVYRAFDERLDRSVAIKKVESGFTREGKEGERFWREAKAIARLRHPAIIEIFDIVEDDDGSWIVMELVEGQTLKQLLEAGPLGLEPALDLFSQLAQALAEAHQHGILHRDLKAENVMVDRHGRAKLLDFGIAHITGQDSTRLTANHRILGTPQAMSPEQTMGETLDHRSDLFAFGSLLYYALTGTQPFHAETAMAVLQKVAFGNYQPAQELRPQLPDGLCRLIDRLLRKRPAHRPESADKVAEQIDGLQASLIGRPPSASAGTAPVLRASATSDATVLEGPPARESTVTTIGERRQITILQCEISRQGSDPDVLDPEELLELKPQLTALVAQELERFGGRLGQELDQGHLVYFGLPIAGEDDARRAVHAACSLVAKAEQGFGHRGLALHVGIHTGPVVVAPEQSAADSAKLAFGETIARVAAVTTLAEPGEVLLSASTEVVVHRFFGLEPLPPAHIPGLGSDILAYRLTGENKAGKVSGSHPFVGREQQLLLLMDHWQLAREGNGQAVLLSGEAGIGKSRLVLEVETRVASHDGLILRCQCSPYEQHTPFAPIIHLLREMIRGGPEGEPTVDELARFLGPFELPLDEIVPLFGSLLSISFDGYPPLELSPPTMRRQTLEALVALVLELAEKNRLLFVVEDLHWIDPSSQELIDLLVKHGPSVPILLLLTARPSFESPWHQRAHVVRLTLGRLGREHVVDLARNVSDGPVDASILERIVDRADGVPLFVEEITKVVTEPVRSGSGSTRAHSSGTLPTSLQDFLMARLDHLGHAKVIAQHAAVLGRAFTLAELVAVTGLDDQQLAEPLQVLVDAELLYRRGMGSALRFTFKHALIQDAAYQSLLKGQRRRIHTSVAKYLEKRLLGGSRVERTHERIARHFMAAGNRAEAIDYLLKAGRSASSRSANKEAAAHFEVAIEQLASQPESAHRDRAELELQTLLGAARNATLGFGSKAVEEAYARAYELCEQAGEAPQMAWILQGLWAFYETRADLPKSVDIGERILRLARSTGEQSLHFEARYALGNSHFFGADFDASRHHLDAALAIELRDRDSRRAATGLDPEISCLAFSAVVQWHAGRPASALERSQRALAEARRLDHPFSLAFAAYMAAWVHQLRREADLLEPLAAEVVELSERHGFFWLPLARMHLGWAMQPSRDGLELIRGGLEEYRQPGARLGCSYYLALLAEAHLHAGQPQEAALSLASAFEHARDSGESFYLPELHRLAARLARQAPSALDGAPPEESLRAGLASAREQGARALELRLAGDLADLLVTRGEDHEGRELLLAVSADFAQAHGTADWHRVQELLAEIPPA